MPEFRESSFIEKQTMWGFEPAESAIMTKDFFLREKAKKILIPGIGYGRNAKIFLESGMNIRLISFSQKTTNPYYPYLPIYWHILFHFSTYRERK